MLKIFALWCANFLMGVFVGSVAAKNEWPFWFGLIVTLAICVVIQYGATFLP